MLGRTLGYGARLATGHSVHSVQWPWLIFKMQSRATTLAHVRMRCACVSCSYRQNVPAKIRLRADCSGVMHYSRTVYMCRVHLPVSLSIITINMSYYNYYETLKFDYKKNYRNKIMTKMADKVLLCKDKVISIDHNNLHVHVLPLYVTGSATGV